MTRREVAALLGMHADSVTRNLRDGLAAAVVQFGGRGRLMVFSRLRVLRWWRAKTCTKRGGRPCKQCALVLEDMQCMAEHQIDAGHGALESCTEILPTGEELNCGGSPDYVGCQPCQ